MLTAAFSGLKAMAGFQLLDITAVGAPRRGAVQVPKPRERGEKEDDSKDEKDLDSNASDVHSLSSNAGNDTGDGFAIP